VIWLDRRGEVVQPRSGKQMEPRVFGVEATKPVSAGPNRLELLAELVTSKDNPFFAKTAVNRVWYQLLGRGIVQPVDDFRDSNPPSNEELLDALASDFVAHKYDIKYLIRTIMNSTTYGLSSQPNDSNADDEIQFSHARVRRLTAEQLLDAISTLTGTSESFSGLPVGMRATQLPDSKVNNYFLQTFGQPNREMACECERGNDSNLSQALQLINGSVVSEKLRSPNGRIQQLVNSKKSDLEIIRELYLSSLSRLPAEPEIQAITEHIKASKDHRRAIEDVVWAIINSKEFLFQH